MPGQYSIKNTLEVLDFGFGIGGAIKSSQADGKIDANDLVNLIPLLPLAGPAFEDLSLVPKELGEMAEDEAKQVLDHCRPKVAGLISDEDLAKKVNAGLKVGLAMAEFLSVL
ncbi:MAG: hypothetical protein E6R04_10240 [Spirochaetes bacterium]|nr:MAG: hypothetical protein E6R04_10240 [Spirochaetota bacterium]